MITLSFSSGLKWVENNIVWGIPLIILILLVGIVLTIKLKFLQLKHLGKSLKCIVKNDDIGSGEVSSFGALCVSMAATLGTGKIVGVAIAISVGGPGALFWMILAALFGMATSYAEGFLSIKYRKFESDGSVTGGPFTYIEEGMGKKWIPLAKCFAIFGCLAGVMGTGTMTQMNSITDSVISVFDPDKVNVINLFGTPFPIAGIIAAVIVTILSAIAIIGGIERISKVASVLVPFMAVTFLVSCLAVVVFNITEVPNALLIIVKEAFNFKAAFGGAAGAGIMIAMKEGVSKGIFSNEAGLGSAPIALSTSKSNDAVKTGFRCMSTTFIDTMILCLTIGLGIVIIGEYQTSEGINITINTFVKGLNIPHLLGSIIVMFCIVTFAFTTIIGWNVYGEKCIAYLTKNSKKAVFIYKLIYIFFVAIAPFLTLDLIWTIASICNGLMAIPNLIAVLCLSNVIKKDTNEYFNTQKKESLN